MDYSICLFCGGFGVAMELKMTRNEILNLNGDFTWDFGNQFFIETPRGNFVWSDPDYDGNNILRAVKCSYKEWIGPGRYGRDKGKHRIEGYCGDKVKIIDLNNNEL